MTKIPTIEDLKSEHGIDQTTRKDESVAILREIRDELRRIREYLAKKEGV